MSDFWKGFTVGVIAVPILLGIGIFLVVVAVNIIQKVWDYFNVD